MCAVCVFSFGFPAVSQAEILFGLVQNGISIFTELNTRLEKLPEIIISVIFI